MQFDPEVFGRAMGEAIRRAVDPLKKEVEELRRELESLSVSTTHPEVDLPDFKAMIEEAMKSVPAPKDGVSITLDDVAPLIGAAVEDLRDKADELLDRMGAATKAAEDRIESLRQPEDGKSVSIDDVKPLIEQLVKSHVEAIPTPKDGVGLGGMLIDRDGNLIATMTNGEVKNLGPVVGRDGISMSDVSRTYDSDKHEIVERWSVGLEQKELRYPAGGIRAKGYWRSGNAAKSGEAWVSDGSLWVAKVDTSDEPSHSSKDWFMAARKGRDGETVVKYVKTGPETPVKLVDGATNAS